MRIWPMLVATLPLLIASHAVGEARLTAPPKQLMELNDNAPLKHNRSLPLHLRNPENPIVREVGDQHDPVYPDLLDTPRQFSSVLTPST